jgi:protein-L-isoaspartate(D-aspartate) O-methyltransferase
VTGRPDWIVEQLVRRGIADERVLDAMARVPRERFVSPELADRAYDDRPLPIGFDQTVSQPYIVAFMCEALALDGEARVLDVGTGSGYGAAVLAELAGEVDTVERIPELAHSARAALDAAGYARVMVHVGNGADGLPRRAPFDAIAVAAVGARLPPALWEQLADGGRIALPLRSGRSGQRLSVVERTPAGPRLLVSRRARFVPLIS